MNFCKAIFFYPEGHYNPGVLVADAVAGGRLTVIANAPNPAGRSILKRYFEDGISPLRLFKAAIITTVIMFLCLVFLDF